MYRFCALTECQTMFIHRIAHRIDKLPSCRPTLLATPPPYHRPHGTLVNDCCLPVCLCVWVRALCVNSRCCPKKQIQTVNETSKQHCSSHVSSVYIDTSHRTVGYAFSIPHWITYTIKRIEIGSSNNIFVQTKFSTQTNLVWLVRTFQAKFDRVENHWTFFNSRICRFSWPHSKIINLNL